MNPIKIKKLEFSEVEALQKISRQTFFETFAEVNSQENMNKYLNENLSLEQLVSELNNPNSEFYFAMLEGSVIGYLKINCNDAQTENKQNDSLEIERIYVLREYLGKKVGQLLFDKAVAIGKEKGKTYVWLGVWEENHRALQFYEKNGFTVFGKHDFVLGDDVQTDLMMKRSI